jgi:hypothetical protein
MLYTQELPLDKQENKIVISDAHKKSKKGCKFCSGDI